LPENLFIFCRAFYQDTLSSSEFLTQRIDRGILVKDDSNSAIYTVARLSKLDFPETAPEIKDDGSVLPSGN